MVGQHSRQGTTRARDLLRSRRPSKGSRWDRLEALLVGDVAPGGPERPEPPAGAGLTNQRSVEDDIEPVIGLISMVPGATTTRAGQPGAGEVSGSRPVGAESVGSGPVGSWPAEAHLVEDPGVGTPPVEAKHVDPRFRRRWIAVRRQEGRRRLRILMGVAAAVVVPVGGWTVAHSSLTSVHRVVLVGEVHTTPEQILQASGLGRHPLMIDLDRGAIERRIDSLPWVASVSLVKQWPVTVKLVVHERSAVAEVPGPDTTLGLVDSTGRVLAVEPGAIGGLVELSGLRLGPVGSTVKPLWRARQLLDLVGALHGDLVPSVQVAGDRSPGQLTAVVEGYQGSDIEVLIGSDGQLREKLIALDTLLNRVPMQGVASIDVRVPGSPVLTRQS